MRYLLPMRISLTILAVASLVASAHAGAWGRGDDRFWVQPQPPVFAQESLRDMRAQQHDEADLRREAAFTSSVCETRISASINWGRSQNWSPAHGSLVDACDDALSALEAVCRGGLKAQVQAKIKNFQCFGDGSGPSLSGGTLRYGAGGGNGYDRTRAYLERVLR